VFFLDVIFIEWERIVTDKYLITNS